MVTVKFFLAVFLMSSRMPSVITNFAVVFDLDKNDSRHFRVKKSTLSPVQILQPRNVQSIALQWLKFLADSFQSDLLV